MYRVSTLLTLAAPAPSLLLSEAQMKAQRESVLPASCSLSHHGQWTPTALVGPHAIVSQERNASLCPLGPAMQQHTVGAQHTMQAPCRGSVKEGQDRKMERMVAGCKVHMHPVSMFKCRPGVLRMTLEWRTHPGWPGRCWGRLGRDSVVSLSCCKQARAMTSR